MARKFKNILSLDSKGAMDFFMKSEQYQGFEMPEYFVFDNLLDKIRDVIADTPYEECLLDGVLPENLSDVNIDILFNKDGKYAVRPLMLASPTRRTRKRVSRHTSYVSAKSLPEARMLNCGTTSGLSLKFFPPSL